MKILRYQAKFSQEKKGFSISFPDLPGCFSSAKTIEEAFSNAREALDLYLEEALDPDWKIPESHEKKGKDYFWIVPSPEISIPLTIRELREKAKLSQPEMARRLNMKVQQYQKLEYPHKSNPTTKSLMAVAESLGYEVEFVKKKGA